MSKLKALAFSSAFALAAIVMLPGEASAQNRTGATVTSVSPGRAVVGRPTVAGRTELRPINRDPRRDPGDHLQERLRNACFNELNPPVTTCRRYFGEGGPGAGGGATRRPGE